MKRPPWWVDLAPLWLPASLVVGVPLLFWLSVG